MDFSLRINLLTIWLLIVARIATGQDHNCVLRFDDNSIVANDEWDTSIDLTSRMDDDLSDVYEVNKDFFTFKTENIKSARVYASDSSVSKYDKYFSVTLDGQNQLHLSTSSEYSKIEEVLTTLNVGFSVSFECATGTKITSFQVRIKDSNNNSPTFSQTQYDFKDVPMPLAVNINLLPMLYQINVLDVDITSQGVDMSLDPTGAEYFSASAVRTGTSKEYSVTLKIIKKLELSEPMTFKLIATDRGTASDQKQVTSEVTVTLEPNVEESVYEPKFVEPLYTAKITESKGVIKFNEGDIKLQGLGQGKVQFVLSDPLGNFDYSSYITCEATSDSVQCSWNEDEHFGELLEQPYALIKLMGKQENYNEDYTIIHLSLPGPPPTTTTTNSDSTTSTPQGSTICPECPATCPDGSTEWSSTSSTGTPEPLTKPEFSEREYEFTIYSPIKNIVLLEPKLKKEVKNVEFSITYGEETEVNWLDIDRKTGAVKLTNYPSVGEHNFQLKAVIPETELIDTVPLIIVVSSGQVCYNSTFVFQARYQRVKVPENKITTILPALETSETVSCTFTFETDIGSTEDYFIVNGTTGHTMVKSLDREADEFNNAAEPTIRLTVNATCGDDDEIQSRRSARGSGDYVGELPRLEFIDNQKSIMDIVVLIQDENDNPPVFNTKSVTVGYPTRELSEVLQPPSLATVQATDADIGENAVITYSLEAGEENNNRFWIHPTTGVIYPRQEDFDDDDDMKIKVSAKDKGGKAANPKLTVNVRPLKNDQVFEVVVAGAVLENVNSVVENISKTSGLDVRVLTSAVVPGTFSSKSRSRRATLRDESSPTALRLVLYALENDKPIELDDFKKKLGDNSEVWQVREIQTTNKGSHGEDTTGYLAAVITLAVLLVLILGGAGVAAYIFIIRPRMKKTADYDRFRQESKDGSESNLSSVVPTIPPLTEDILKKKYDADVSPVALNGSLTERQYENTSDHYETTDWATSHETLPRQPETPEWGSLEVSLPRQTETQSAVQTPADYLLAPPEIPPARKRSLTLYGDEDLDESGERRDDSSNDYDVPDENAVEKANRRKSVVTFNENVDTIEIERL
ncbi:cadherin-23 isoform X5 [Anabrus simplex]|uniref:cadherin-23 isoform X5 n=1 Tax=Anabrus simplex TaxID=316456 RepID=UPI0035A37B2A